MLTRLAQNLGYTLTLADKEPLNSACPLSDIVFDIGPPGRDSRSDTAQDMEEQRVASIENDVLNLKSDVSAINGKLDEVLEAMARISMNPASHSGHQHTASKDANVNHTAAVSDAAANTSESRETQTVDQQRGRAASTHHMVDTKISLEDFVHREPQRDKFEAKRIYLGGSRAD